MGTLKAFSEQPFTCAETPACYGRSRFLSQQQLLSPASEILVSSGVSMAEPPPQPRALPRTPSLRVSGRPRSYSRHSRRTSPSTSASPTHRWRNHPSASPQRAGCVGGLAEPASGSQGASSSAAAIPAKAAPWRQAVASPPLPRQRAASQAPAVAFGVKWQLALVNFGAPRHEGEEVYTQNIYNVPAWVVLCCELHDTAHERILSEYDEWRPPGSADPDP